MRTFKFTYEVTFSAEDKNEAELCAEEFIDQLTPEQIGECVVEKVEGNLDIVVLSDGETYDTGWLVRSITPEQLNRIENGEKAYHVLKLSGRDL